jgi:hypothetical protein
MILKPTVGLIAALADDIVSASISESPIPYYLAQRIATEILTSDRPIYRFVRRLEIDVAASASAGIGGEGIG